MIDNISAIAVPVFRSSGSSFPSSFPKKDLLEIDTKIGKLFLRSLSFLMISTSRSAQSYEIFVYGSLFFTSEERRKKPMAGSTTIFSFEIFKHFSKKQDKYKSGYKSSIAKKSEVNKFLTFIIKGLDKKGFLQPDHKRQSMIRNINNIFHRIDLSEQEIRILLGIFSTLNEFNNKT